MSVRDDGFQPGHELSKRHGAYSPAEIEKRAEVVHEHLLTIAPWIAEDHYMPSVSRYLQATAREQLAHEALIGMEPGARGFGRLVESATAASRLAWMMADQLGLTPGGHSRLKMLAAGGAEAEQSIGDLIEQGRLIRERREAEDAAAAAIEADAVDDGQVVSDEG